MEVELVPLDGPLQVGHELVALDDGEVHVGAEELDAVLAGGLGGGHGHVGVAEELVGPPPGVAHRDADRGPDEQLLAVQHDRATDGFEQRLGDVLGRTHLRAVEQDAELVTTEAGGRVLRSEHLLDARRQGDEELVADGVPEGVVDDLEVVDADEEHGHAGLVAAREVEGELDPLDELAPVGQGREGVVVRLVAQLRLEVAELLERLLEGAALEDHAQVPGQGLEEVEVGPVEVVDLSDPVADQDGADDTIVAADDHDHGLAYPALVEGGDEAAGVGRIEHGVSGGE